MYDGVIKISLEDVGTRYQHLSDILESWELGLDVLEHQTSSETNQTRIQQLKAGISLLRTQMDQMAGFSSKVWDLREEINRIPKNSPPEPKKPDENEGSEGLISV